MEQDDNESDYQKRRYNRYESQAITRSRVDQVSPYWIDFVTNQPVISVTISIGICRPRFSLGGVRNSFSYHRGPSQLKLLSSL